jgi:hypothetical protein
MFQFEDQLGRRYWTIHYQNMNLYEAPRWDPEVEDYERLEELLARPQGLGMVTGDRERRSNTRKKPWIGSISRESLKDNVYRECSQCDAVMAGICTTLNDDTFGQQLRRNCIVGGVVVEHKSGRTSITPEQLARNWSITLGRARRTLELTIQRMIRSRPMTEHYAIDAWHATCLRVLCFQRCFEADEQMCAGVCCSAGMGTSGGNEIQGGYTLYIIKSDTRCQCTREDNIG